MAEVIYQLKFGSGQVYIGYTANYWQRVNTHITKLKYGYHTKRLQHAYDIFGLPEYQVIHILQDNEDGYDMERQCIAGAGARSLNFKHGNLYEQWFIDKNTYTIVNRYGDDPTDFYNREHLITPAIGGLYGK